MGCTTQLFLLSFAGLSHLFAAGLLPVCLPLPMLSAFGTKTVPPQPVFKALPALFESKDGKAREKVKDLVVSAHAQSTQGHLPSQRC